MEALRRFWRQASTHYRNYQLVSGFVVVASIGFGLLWSIAPRLTLEWFAAWNRALGGDRAIPSAGTVALWRYVAAGYAICVALVARWLRRDLRNRRAGLAPLVGFVAVPGALEFVAAALHGSLAPGLLGAGFVHLAAAALLGVFGTLAYADIRGHDDRALIPRPLGPSLLGWTHFEERWVEQILAATLPPRPEDDQPGFGDVELRDFWERYVENVPLHFRLGLRAATWGVTFWPILTLRSVRTFHGLSDEERDEVLRSIERSRFFLVRQFTFVLKTTLGFGYFRTPEIQKRYPTAYGVRDEPADEA